jgi:chromosome partitioning protein
MRLIAVMNQKGGVGKTTTTLNLAHALTQRGYRVVVVDLDPQGHLGVSLGVVDRRVRGLDRVLLEGVSIDQCMIDVRQRMQLLPAGIKLGEVEHVVGGGAKRGWLLKRALEKLNGDYDYILIDSPPSSGLLSMNGLLAASELVIPVSADYLALQGLSRMFAIIRYIEKALKINHRKHLVLTRFEASRQLGWDVRKTLLSYFPGQVLATVVREAEALAISPGFGKTIFEYRPESVGADDYRSLAEDLVIGRALQ